MIDVSYHLKQEPDQTITTTATIRGPHDSITEPYVVVAQSYTPTGKVSHDITTYMSFDQFRDYREQMRAALDSVELPGDAGEGMTILEYMEDRLDSVEMGDE